MRTARYVLAISLYVQQQPESNMNVVRTLLFHMSCWDVERCEPPQSGLPSSSSITPATVNGRIILLLVVDWEVPPLPPVTECICETGRECEGVYLYVNMHLLDCAWVSIRFIFGCLFFPWVSVSSRQLFVHMCSWSAMRVTCCTHTHTRTHTQSVYFNSLAPGSSCSAGAGLCTAGQALPVKGPVVTGGPCAHSPLFVFYVIMSPARLHWPAPSK